MFKLNSWSVFM